MQIKLPRAVAGKELVSVIEEAGKELGHITHQEHANRYVPGSVKTEEILTRVTSKQYPEKSKSIIDKISDAIAWLSPSNGPFLYLWYSVEVEPDKSYEGIELKVFEHYAGAIKDYPFGAFDSRLKKYEADIRTYVEKIMGKLSGSTLQLQQG